MWFCIVISVKYFNCTSLLHMFFFRVLKLIPNYSKQHINVWFNDTLITSQKEQYKSRVLKWSHTNKITLHEYKYHRENIIIKSTLYFKGWKTDLHRIIIGVCINGLLKANKSSLCTIHTVVTEIKQL